MRSNKLNPLVLIISLICGILLAFLAYNFLPESLSNLKLVVTFLAVAVGFFAVNLIYGIINKR